MTADARNGHRGGVPGLASNAITLLTREATRMPMLALSLGLQAWEQTRGIRKVAVRRGNEVLQIAAHTPLGRFLPQPAVEHDIAIEAERIATEARQAPPPAPTPIRSVPATPEPPAAAVEVGAPGAVTDTVEKVTEQLHIDEPTSRDDLPIPDFDNVSLASLRARLRSLSVEQLATLREWERAHANRLPVVTLLDNRIAKLSSDGGAQA